MERKPEWLRVRYNRDAVNEVAELMRDLKPQHRLQRGELSESPESVIANIRQLL